MSGSTRSRTAALAWLVLAPVALADTPPEPPSRTLPYECEAWTEQVESLQESGEELERELGELHAEPDLGYCQTQRVRLDEEPDDAPSRSLDIPAWMMLTELARWLFIAVLAALVVWLLWRWQRHRRPAPGSGDSGSHPAAPVRHAAAEKEGALPDDIPAAAAQAWQAGQFRTAISLLYRGAVERLLPRHQADTEREVLAALRRQGLSEGTRRYFDDLVQIWLQTAWAHSPPTAQRFQELHQQWPAHCADASEKAR